MTMPQLRTKLHELIDTSPEDKLSEVYAVFEEEYTDDFKRALDNEYDEYRKDGEVISKEQLDSVVESLLHGK